MVGSIADNPAVGSRRPPLIGRLLAASALAGFGVLTAGAAIAAPAVVAAPPQAAPGASTPAAETAGTGSTVGEVIVTAQRRSERLQDVPIAVTAVTGEDLNRNRINDVSRLQLVTPGLTWNQQGSDSFPAIRGVRTQLVGAKNDPVIGFYIDGVYQSRTQQQSIPLFDLARVEVQRGPQGTLYGRNTFGGNISVVTNEPNKSHDAGVDGMFGNYGMAQVSGYINVPVNDTLQLRFAADHISHDPYVHSNTSSVEVADDDENAFRASLRWTPTERLEVLLHLGYWEREDKGGGAFGYKIIGTLINPATGRLSLSGVPVAVNPTVHNGSAFIAGVDVGVPVSGGPYTNQWDYQPFESIHERSYSAQVNYDLGPVVLRSITGYTNFEANRSADLDQSSVVFPLPGVTGGFPASGVQYQIDKDGAFSEEVQVASKDSTPLQYVVGGYFLHDKIKSPYTQFYTNPVNTPITTRSVNQLDTNAYAGYAQASYFVVPELLRVIGGIRYSTETKDYDIGNFTSPAGSNVFVQTPVHVAGSPTFSKTTWRAGLEYTPTRNTMIYFTASTGFESGGFNDNSTNKLIPATYNAQTVNAYELGTKERLFSGRVVLEASAFHNDFSNLQITILDPSTNLSYTASAGAAFSEGLEFSAKTLLIDNFHVDFTASLLDAKFTSYTRPNAFRFGTDPLTVNLSGKKVPVSPSVKTTLAVYYDFDLGVHGKITPYLDWLHSSSYFTLDYNTALDRQAPSDIVDLSLRWTSPSGKYYVEGFGNNVTNEAVLYSSTVGNSGRIQSSYSPPPTYGVHLGAKF